MSIVMSVNAGSSSLKFQVFKMPEEEVLAQGNVERIGLKDSIFGMKVNGEKFETVQDIEDHAQAVEHLINALIEHKVVNSLDDIKAIGHRMVHAGEYYAKSVPASQDVVDKIEECSELAPLHNPAGLTGYFSFKKALPNCSHTLYLIQLSIKACLKKTTSIQFHTNIIQKTKFVVMVCTEQVICI